VDPDGQPVITLAVAGQDWNATIDTGFTGDLQLPDPLRSLLAARFIFQGISLLADGRQILEDIYEVVSPFDGQQVTAEATFVASSEILIGTHLLRQYRLEIDFVLRTVLLQRAAATGPLSGP
jgi:predicted aspartyl protease